LRPVRVLRAKARRALTFIRQDETVRLGVTKSAGMSQGESLSIEHICDED
jgi:hypothetical protein